LAFCFYLVLINHYWAAVPGGRFSNIPPSPSLNVGRKLFFALTCKFLSSFYNGHLLLFGLTFFNNFFVPKKQKTICVLHSVWQYGGGTLLASALVLCWALVPGLSVSRETRELTLVSQLYK